MQNTQQHIGLSKEEGGDQMNIAANNSNKRALDSYSPEDDQNSEKFTDDDKLAKKQRRLVKNREAAAQFRHRQKAYMQKLEKHAEELTQSNIQVTAKIELLDTENKLMKEQLAYLRNFMKQAVALSFPNSLPSLPPDSVPPTDVPPASSLPVIPDLFPDDIPPPVDTKANIKMEPTSIVPDITNFTPSIVPTTSPSPSPTPSPPTITITSTPTMPLPPPTLFSSPSKGPLITSTNLLADPYLAAAIPTPSIIPTVTSTSSLSISSLLASSSPSPLLGPNTSLSASSTLSSIFNSILGTDLSFSGVLVKNEQFEHANPQP